MVILKKIFIDCDPGCEGAFDLSRADKNPRVIHNGLSCWRQYKVDVNNYYALSSCNCKSGYYRDGPECKPCSPQCEDCIAFPY